MQTGIMSIPAIAIDGKIVMSGRIPTPNEATALMHGNSQKLKSLCNSFVSHIAETNCRCFSKSGESR